MLTAQKTKVEASDVVLCKIKNINRQSGFPARSFHTDSSREFKIAKLKLKEIGANTTTTTIYTLLSNGIVGRAMSTVFSMGGIRLVQSKLPFIY